MIHAPRPLTLQASDAVRLHVLTTDRFKTARLSIYTMTPAHPAESPKDTLLFGILRRGSEKYPRLSLINRRLDDLYGTTLTLRNFLSGDKHVLSLTAEMLEDAYVPAEEGENILRGTMEIIAEILLHPLLDGNGYLRTDAVEQEKKALCDSIRSDVNDTRAYAASRLRHIMCAGEPFGLSLSGQVEEIMALTAEDVTDAFRKRLARARWEVFYTGRASAHVLTEYWQDLFGHWQPSVLELPTTHPHMPPAIPKRVDESLPVGQGKLCMAWSSGITCQQGTAPDDYAAAVVLCELLGIMQSSLLFRRVREELGLCYYCDAAFEGKKGILTVTSGIHPKNRDAAERAISACMEALAMGEVSPEDVQLAHTSLESSYRQIPDSPASMEAYWFWSVEEKEACPPQVFLDRLLCVTPADVARVAKKFKPDTVYFLNGTRAEEGEDGLEPYDD